MIPDFDIQPDRRGSGAMKWDENPGALPLWVADMDFQTAPCVIEALERRVRHGIFGYTLVRPAYYEALQWWFATYHGLAINRDSVIYVPGVVPALSAIIKALVRPGDGVIVQTPVYNCFFSSIRNNGCRIVENPLRKIDLSESEFSYEMNFDHLEEVASDPHNTLMLLCNPHNPAGRAWTADELRRVADICHHNGVTVVSDEIHCDLTMPGYNYVPYQTIDQESIACLSPSKAFNTAGLQIANIICPDAEQRRLIDRAININEVCDVNPFGVEGLIAAYTSEGHEWLEQLRHYLWKNYRFLCEYIAENLPGVPVAKLEATYLPWLDISRFNLPSEELEEEILSHTGVRVNSGLMYGKDGFIRINIACPRATLEEGLRRLCAYLKCLE